MFTMKDLGTTEARETLKELKTKFVYSEKESANEVLTNLDTLISDLTFYVKAPKCVITPVSYKNSATDVGANGLDGVAINIRPSIKAEITTKHLWIRKEFDHDANIYANVVEFISGWFDTYRDYEKVQANLDVFNAEIQSICDEVGNFNVKFVLGKLINDVSDKSIEIGLDLETIMGLGRLSIFNALDSVSGAYKRLFKEVLVACSYPYEIITIKSPITKDLNIYTRKSVYKVIRDIVNRNEKFVHSGTGYIETSENFAVVVKEPLREEDVASFVESLNGAEYVISDNECNSVEKKKNQTKKVTYYKVSPFNKTTLSKVDVALSK